MQFKKQVQIKSQSGVQIGTLLFNKIFTEVPAEYFNYNNIFLIENVAKFLENTKINKHAIKLKEDK